jgi:hypothetical protein
MRNVVVPVAGTIVAEPAGLLLGASAADAAPIGSAADARAVTPTHAAIKVRNRRFVRLAFRSSYP